METLSVPVEGSASALPLTTTDVLDPTAKGHLLWMSWRRAAGVYEHPLVGVSCGAYARFWR